MAAAARLSTSSSRLWRQLSSTFLVAGGPSCRGHNSRLFHSCSSLSFAATTDSNNSTSSTNAITKPSTWSDPQRDEFKYWNREEGAKEAGSVKYLLDFSPWSIQTEARILSLSPPNDPANQALHQEKLVAGATMVGIGQTADELLQALAQKQQQQPPPNVLFVSPSCPHVSVELPKILHHIPSLEWIHVRSAGIDFLMSDALTAAFTNSNITVTNAKGQFSSSLAEYVMMACAYFAKDLPRLLKNQGNKTWDPFCVQELRGKTMGIVGYGDIGRACAKLATVYGMRIVALRRRPYLSRDDCMCDVVYGTDKESLNQLMSESDYIVCSAPSTAETKGMVNADAFAHVKQDAVFMNLGRGPVVDEDALLQALQSGRLRGAALDVFAQEPLPADHPFWECDNLLLSPHNMDQTATFMHEATEFFVNENLPRFIVGDQLLNPVDIRLGY